MRRGGGGSVPGGLCRGTKTAPSLGNGTRGRGGPNRPCAVPTACLAPITLGFFTWKCELYQGGIELGVQTNLSSIEVIEVEEVGIFAPFCLFLCGIEVEEVRFLGSY